jgi:hypothetical protein
MRTRGARGTLYVTVVNLTRRVTRLVHRVYEATRHPTVTVAATANRWPRCSFRTECPSCACERQGSASARGTWGEDETAGEAGWAVQSELEHVQTGSHSVVDAWPPQATLARRRSAGVRAGGAVTAGTVPETQTTARVPPWLFASATLLLRTETGTEQCGQPRGLLLGSSRPPAARPGRGRPVAVVRSVQSVDGRHGQRCARARTSAAFARTCLQPSVRQNGPPKGYYSLICPPGVPLTPGTTA